MTNKKLPKKRVFIDTNIYLDYFSEQSKDRLLPLKELVRIIEENKIEIFLPKQTIDEFNRNRKNIAEKTRVSLVNKKFEIVLPPSFDSKGKDKIVKDVIKKNKEINSALDKFVKKYVEDVKEEKTEADILIKNIFSKTVCPINSEIVKRAHERYMRSNPPRKNDHSYGDAIVWEAILEYAIDKDLVLITRDNDYIEKFGGEDDLHTFLKDEWSRKTKKKIKFYKSLGQFINDFEKQPKVKEEIVQKETEKPIVQGFYDIPVSSISSTSFLNPSNTFLNQAYTTVSASSLINSDTIGFSSTVINAGIYCPYCKTKVSDNLYSVYKPIVIRYGKQYKCPNSMCLKEFSIN